MATVIVCDKQGCAASFQPTEDYLTLKVGDREIHLCRAHFNDFEGWLNAPLQEVGTQTQVETAQATEATQVAAPANPAEQTQEVSENAPIQPVEGEVQQ